MWGGEDVRRSHWVSLRSRHFSPLTRGRSGNDWRYWEEDARLDSAMIDWNTDYVGQFILYFTPSFICPTGKIFWIIKGIHETLMSISMWENQSVSKVDGESGEIEDYQHWPGPRFWIVISTSKMIHPALCILSPQIKDQLNMDRILKNLLCRKNSWLLPASTLQTELTIRNRYGGSWLLFVW